MAIHPLSRQRAVLAAVVCALLGIPALRAADSVRTISSFDADWRFLKADATGAEAPAFDDAKWTLLSVPHDWSIEGPLLQNAPTKGAGAFAPAGVAWYRKSFASPDKSKKTFVTFDGIMENSDVWINGTHLGKRPNGYVSIQYDLTPHLNTDGKPNTLAVRADTSKQPASRYYSGGGIYRHVRLQTMDPVHIDNWGTFVTTPKVAADAATVHVRSTVVNQSAAPRDIALQLTILGPDGKPVATAQTKPQSVPAGKSIDFDQDVSVATPKLWDLDTPNLYTATAAIRAGDTTLDDQTVTFGIRDFQFKPDTGFWLNGKNFKIKGSCLHQDAGGLGVAVPEDEWIERLTALKQYGCNAVRAAHNPQSPEFFDACDKVGMLVMDEMFDCWDVAKSPFDYHLFFDQWNLIDTRDTVRRDRNHPAIIMYSAGNEIRDTPNAAKAIPMLTALVNTFHENDPTRPVTMGLFRPNQDGNGGAYKNGLAKLLDVVGTNYRFAELLAAHQANPEFKIIGTENGLDLGNWAAVRNNPAYAGYFIWTGIDYLGESKTWPEVASAFGFLDITTQPKAESAKFASWWSDKPVVGMVRAGGQVATGVLNPDEPQTKFTATVDWTPANLQAHDEKVEVFSNCQEVELFLNDQSLGAKPRGEIDSIRTWQVPFAPGVLKAVGKNNGQAVATHILTTAGKPAKIALKTTREKLFADFDSMAHVVATITDEKGISVPGANNQLTFKITGPGTVTALATGAITAQPFRGNSHYAYMGQCSAYLHATAAGKFQLTVSSPGIADAVLNFDAAPARASH